MSLRCSLLPLSLILWTKKLHLFINFETKCIAQSYWKSRFSPPLTVCNCMLIWILIPNFDSAFFLRQNVDHWKANATNCHTLKSVNIKVHTLRLKTMLHLQKRCSCQPNANSTQPKFYINIDIRHLAYPKLELGYLRWGPLFTIQLWTRILQFLNHKVM